MENPNSRIDALIAATQQAGRLIKKSFLDGSITSIDTKVNKSDIVTNIDIDSERVIYECIEKHFPKSIKIYSEESSQSDSPSIQSDNIAIIDPLDGTNNFLVGIPYFSISILIRSEGDTIAIIYNPVTELLLLNRNGDQALLLNNHQIPFDNFLNRKTDYSLDNLSYAVISGYSIPPQTTEPFLQYLYYTGAKRVMSNWSPAQDYMNLILKRLDCVISLSEESFSEAAGRHCIQLSVDHDLVTIIKTIGGAQFPITVSANSNCISSIKNLIESFELP